MQPVGRFPGSRDGRNARYVTWDELATDEGYDWHALAISGNHGLITVVMALAFWAADIATVDSNLTTLDARWKEWREAVKDVRWVLEVLSRWKAKDGKGAGAKRKGRTSVEGRASKKAR